MKKAVICVWAGFCSITTYAQAPTQAQSMVQSFKQYTQLTENFMVGSSANSIATLSRTEDTQGSEYLLTNWAAGKVTLKNGSVYPESTPVLNFDKMKQSLVLKISATQVFEIDMATVESFELNDSSQVYKFVKLDKQPAGHAIELYKDNSNSLYKIINTKFFKADYANKGLYESGYKYDRYLDDSSYYIKTSTGSVINVTNCNKKKLAQLENDIPGIAEAIKKAKSPANQKDLFLTEVLKGCKK